MNKILVLGSNGLIGSSLVEYLASKDYKVGALSKNHPKETIYNIKYYTVDILNFELLKEVIIKYDIIINTVGQITKPMDDCLTLNTLGISNLANIVNEYDKVLIHISSLAVYGTHCIVDENTIPSPETQYGMMKYFADFLIQEKVKKHIILRVSNIFSTNQTKGIFAYLKKQYLLNESNIYFNNNGELSRFYLNLSDLLVLIESLIEKSSLGIYNISGRTSYSIKDLIFKFESLLGFEFNVTYDESLSKENIEFINRDKMMTLLENLEEKSVDEYIKELKNETL